MVTDATLRLWKTVGYEPHSEAQWRYHRSDARFRVPASGRRFGKSEMTEKDWLPDLFDQEKTGRFWMVALSYDTCDEFQFLWDDVIVKMGLGNAPGLKKANNVRTGEMFIEFPWGTRVDVKSIKQPTTLVGKGLRRILLSEAAKMPAIIFKKYIRPALADYRGKCDMPSTPEGFNWYYSDAYLKGQDPSVPDWESWNFPSWENTVLFPGGFDDPEIQSMLPKDDDGEPIDDPWFWQEIGAQFRTLAGMIYKEFNRDVHVKPITFDPRIPNYLTFDWGFSAPFVALDVMVTGSDDVYVWREYYQSGLPVHVHAEELRQRENPEGYSVKGGYGDSADPDAVDTMGRMYVPVIADPEAKSVWAGIRLVKSFLRPESGPPKLFVSPNCPNLIREMESYRLKQSRSIMTADAEALEEPLKKDDHGPDALRYLLMHLFKLGGKDSLADIGTSEEKVGGIFTRKETEDLTIEEAFKLGRTM